jgi:short-subunit dehydrogenase
MKLTERNVAVVGATSAIAVEVLRLLADARCSMVLGARNSAKLDALAADLRIRGAPTVEPFLFDTNEFSRHDEFLAFAMNALGSIDIVFIAHGTLLVRADRGHDPDQIVQNFSTNATSTISLVTRAAEIMVAQRAGLIVVLSSVAGDRGRGSNYVYGAAKSAVSTFLQGLRAKLHGSNVRVLTVKPGFVDTPMTDHMTKSILFASPRRVARPIVRAMQTGRRVIYVPWFWRWIMLIVRLVPEPLFNRLKV